MNTKEALKCLRQNAPYGFYDDNPEEHLINVTHLDAAECLAIALEDYSKVKAECELLNKELRAVADDLSFLQPATTAEDWGYRLSKVAARRLRKAEAELEKVKDNLDMMTKNRDYWLEKTQGAKAKLARYRRYDPLIEAAEGADKNLLAESINNLEFLLEKFTTAYYGAGQDLAILRAALKCRDSEPKGDGDPVDDGLSPEDMKKREEQFKYDEMERRHEQSVEDAYDKESEPK